MLAYRAGNRHTQLEYSKNKLKCFHRTDSWHTQLQCLHGAGSYHTQLQCLHGAGSSHTQLQSMHTELAARIQSYSVCTEVITRITSSSACIERVSRILIFSIMPSQLRKKSPGIWTHAGLLTPNSRMWSALNVTFLLISS